MASAQSSLRTQPLPRDLVLKVGVSAGVLNDDCADAIALNPVQERCEAWTDLMGSAPLTAGS